MPIPMPQKYMSPEGGIGKIANYQDTQIDTKFAGEAIPFGCPLEATEGNVSKYSTGVFFGVAVAKNYVNEIPYDNGDKVGEYLVAQPVSVLRKGTIWVKAADDVKESELAIPDGTGFKTTATKADAIGTFQSTAQAGNLVKLQINLP